MYARLLGLLLLVLGAGCSLSPSPPDPGAGPLVWVAKLYVGGQQCTAQRFQPPGPDDELEGAGVAVYETAVVPQGTCAACVVCPSYAARHYAQIRESNTGRAAEIGFEAAEAPDKD